MKIAKDVMQWEFSYDLVIDNKITIELKNQEQVVALQNEISKIEKLADLIEQQQRTIDRQNIMIDEYQNKLLPDYRKRAECSESKIKLLYDMNIIPKHCKEINDVLKVLEDSK